MRKYIFILFLYSVQFNAQNTPGISILDNGNVGIFNDSPTKELDVVGTATIDTINVNDVYVLPSVDGDSGQVLLTDGNGNLTWQNLDGSYVCTTYSENFDGGFPGAWSRSSSTFVTTQIDPCNTGDNLLMRYTGQYAQTPNIDLSACNGNVTISYDWMTGSTTGTCGTNTNYPESSDKIYVQYYDGSSWVNVDTINGVNANWQNKSVSILSPQNTDFKLKFLINNAGTTDYFDFDNVNIEAMTSGETNEATVTTDYMFNPSTGTYVFEDFIQDNDLWDNHGLSCSGSTICLDPGTIDHPGQMQFVWTSSAYTRHWGVPGKLVKPQAGSMFEMLTYFKDDQPDSYSQERSRWGFMNESGGTTVTNGAYFTNNGTTLTCVSVKNGTKSSTNVTGISIGNWTKFKVLIESNKVEFYVNGSLVHTVTSASYIPDDTVDSYVRAQFSGMNMEVWWDYFYYQLKLNR